MIVIVDYGMGNNRSVQNMLKKIGVQAKIASETEEILRADKIIIPGVGAFDEGMKNLEMRNLIKPINFMVHNKKIKILGICLGMQLFTESSEEGVRPGFGWVPAKTVRFKKDINNEYKIPHIGWNRVDNVKSMTLFRNLTEENKFYFVHSYYVSSVEAKVRIAQTHYGHNFVSAFQFENIFGVQFHPEKSHKYGMQLLKNFVELS